jgi:hypothetical protein
MGWLRSGSSSANGKSDSKSSGKSGSKSSNDVKSVHEPNGNTSTYFGGRGRADGPGHGHVVTNSDGKVTYARESASNGGEKGWRS